MICCQGGNDNVNEDAPKKESPASDQRMSSALLGSFTILQREKRSGFHKTFKLQKKAYATRKVSEERLERFVAPFVRYDLMVQAYGVLLLKQPGALKSFSEGISR